jgi:hypothetical protein
MSESKSVFSIDVNVPSAADINPTRFYGLIDLMRSIESSKIDKLSKGILSIREASAIMDNEAESLAKSNNAMLQEIRATTRMRNPLEDLENMGNDFRKHKHNLSQNNFLRVAFDVTSRFQHFFRIILDTAENLIPQPIMVSDDRFDGKCNDFQRLMAFQIENQINNANINRFVSSLMSVDELTAATYNLLGKDIELILDNYYLSLLGRHSNEGMEIFNDPIVTDIAMAVYENIDAHGEIESGKNPDEISAYSVRKAQVIGRAISSGMAKSFITKPGFFMEFISHNLTTFWEISSMLQDMFSEEIVKAKQLMNNHKANKRVISRIEFNTAIESLEDLNPINIVYKPSTKLLSSEERFERNFKNETIKNIVNMLNSSFDEANVSELIQFVLNRKKKLRAYYQDENSFYVCKIGAGNAFSGEAPGALTVIPGERPNVSLDNIIGSGFDNVKKFISEIESASKWHDLFVATSPSKTADKSNVLLVGPQGCVAEDTFVHFEVRKNDGTKINHKGGSIRKLHRRFHKLKETGGPKRQTDVFYTVPSMNDEGKIFHNYITDVVATGEKECFKLKVRGGETIIATADHKFYVGDKYIELCELRVGSNVFLHRNIHYTASNPASKNNRRQYLFVKHHPIAGTKVIDNEYVYKRLAKARAVAEANMNDISLDTYISKLNNGNLEDLKFLPRDFHVHHKDENFLNDSLDNLLVVNGIKHNQEHAIKDHNNLRYEVVEDEIVEIVSVGIKKTYDIKMSAPFHNYIADKFVVHNCGKSEILRSVAGDKKSIGVYAQGSDFNTCWKGEMEKNPKRLFEAALKLHKDSGKHVHILIDEIDSVLRKPELSRNGDSNLTLEFQTLMDGVVHYPSLSVWGATNTPQNIPIAMIRRFNSVIICGKLNNNHRIQLLKNFTDHIPTSEFSDQIWSSLAERLEGATGDVIRKVADYIWREKMSAFVNSNHSEAEKLVKWLNENNKFEISKFSAERRAQLKEKLSKFTKVSPKDVDASITIHLENIAIRNEIDTAVKTYANAEAFLDQLKNKKVEQPTG